MAELYIRTVDKVNPESIYKDVKCPKRGDVIVVKPDGWHWTQKEKNSPTEIIVKYPGIDPEDLSGFKVPEAGDPKTQKNLQRRQFFIDLDISCMDLIFNNLCNFTC